MCRRRLWSLWQALRLATFNGLHTWTAPPPYRPENGGLQQPPRHEPGLRLKLRLILTGRLTPLAAAISAKRKTCPPRPNRTRGTSLLIVTKVTIGFCREYQT
jgi:hypothetical protein